MLTAKKLQTTENQSPVARLHALLVDDMRAVNAEILKRMQSPVSLIPQLAAHLIAAGGKRLRPLLTLAAAKICSNAGQSHITLAAAVEFIHTATLLHDDVVDESQSRRGKDTANAIWGNKSSVLVGDFLFSRSFQLMVEAKSLDVLDVLSNAAATIAEGEVQQLLTANNLNTTESDYFNVIAAKTAALFSAACQVGAMVANAPNAAVQSLADYGFHLGLAFQISDDVYDYFGLPGKDAGDDFRDGKVTLPIILAYARSNAEQKKFWKKCIETQNQSEDDFESAIEILNAYDCLNDSLAIAAKHQAKARAALQFFPASPIRDLLIETAEYAAKR